MDDDVRGWIDNLGSSDDQIRMKALNIVLELTDSKVNWVYEVWDGLLEKLNHENSFQRSIAIKVMCNLAKSDTERRLDASLSLLLAHTKDDKFITSRQCLQSIWKVAVKHQQCRERILTHLEKRFRECVEEKHYNLLRQDIIQSFRSLYEKIGDDLLLLRAQTLLLEEREERYRKRYEAILKGL